MAFVALLCGCQTNTGGLGSTTKTSTEDTGETTAAAGTTSTSATSDETTVGGTTTGATTGTDGATTVASTGPGESSSSASDESGDPPPLGEPYGPCTREGTCVGADVACFDNAAGQICMPPCDGTNPSCPPPPPDNGALVECVQVQGIHCMLNCAGGTQCPQGTECVDLGGGIFRCLWD